MAFAKPLVRVVSFGYGRIFSQDFDSSGFGEAVCSSVGAFGRQNYQGPYSRSTSTGVLRKDSSAAPHHKRKVQCPCCRISSVHGASREEADRERTADDAFTTRDASVLLNFIKRIEPLDISLISKEASPDSTDAMKRTISGMLGLLPSDQFQVIIEFPREPLARLLVSSMMTGYTLRNAEYRLCLQRSLDLSDENVEDRADHDGNQKWDSVRSVSNTRDLLGNSAVFKRNSEPVSFPEELGPVSPKVAKYIQQLQAKLSTTSQELEECKLALTTLEMENMGGEEKNDLLDYLRSLEPEQVAELSQPTSPDVEYVIQQVIDGLLSNLCLDKSCTAPPVRNTIRIPWDSDTPAVVTSEPQQCQSTATASRDYLARLLFWCMLLGHHMRAVEYRLELSRTLSLSGEALIGMEGSWKM